MELLDMTARQLEAPRLADLYWLWFASEDAIRPEELAQAYRLRFQVYCREHPFEDPDAFPDEQERDAHDDLARHCLLRYRPTGEAVGTVRMILPQLNRLERSFPLQAVCTEAKVRDPESFPVARMAEVSRFCVTKQFRKRAQDFAYPATYDADDVFAAMKRRVIPNMMLGLIEGLVRMSGEEGVHYWCAMMEPCLLRLLARIGIHFDPLGDLVDHHGRRQPCYTYLPAMLHRTERERQDVWDVITDNGRHLRRFP